MFYQRTPVVNNRPIGEGKKPFAILAAKDDAHKDRILGLDSRIRNLICSSLLEEKEQYFFF